ncbi:MAG: transglycosylase domain-containing protein [Parcubacteria group bacterium]|nr:transglycosylase domain-containing protein [Parcubacteria group bacterium]
MSGKIFTARRYKLPVVLGGVLVFGFLLIGGLSFWVLTLKIPDLHALGARRVAQSTKIYDRTGTVLLFDIHEEIKRTIIPFEEIPRHAKNAAVAIEDDNFYRHKGISPVSILRAFFVDIFSGDLRQGGSTITQQLIKNTFLTTDRTLARKLKEAVLALKLERTIGKDEVLNLYLNEIPYGSNIYGIEAAAESFFGKHARELTLAEAAYLASLPKAPTYYSPYGQHQAELERRKDVVLERMGELGYISEEELSAAKEETPVFVPKGNESIKAPHFVFYVREQLDALLGERRVAEGGFRVITSLDWNLQQQAEDMTKEYIARIEETFTASNAAMVGIDPKTGQVLVMVGSRDWFAPPLPDGCNPGKNCAFEPQVNAAAYATGRQPGSAIKPVIYATAFKKGYTPDTVVFDLETEFNSSCNPDGTAPEGVDPEECYRPGNYDEKFRGPVRLRDALAQSINIPSVKTLYLAGLEDSLKTARDLGITTLNDPERYGLTLVLGGGEVRLLELVGAYGVFANDGMRNPTVSILQIEDSDGNTLREFAPQPKQALDTNTARMISDVLSDEEARAPAFGRHSYLYFEGRDVAAKTGTTNDSRDAWVVGYTPNFALGLWVGNNDNRQMVKKVAGFIAAPLWNAFFQEVLASVPDERFTPPEVPAPRKPVLRGEWRGGRSYNTDAVSGKLATPHTPAEFIREKVLQEVHSILYWVDKKDPDGPPPSEPEKDAQFRLWEEPVRAWAATQGLSDNTSGIPKETDDVHLPEYQPTLTIPSAKIPSSLGATEALALTLVASGHFAIKQIDVFVDDQYVGSVSREPYEIRVDLSRFNIAGTQAILRAVVYDTAGNRSSAEKVLYIQQQAPQAEE